MNTVLVERIADAVLYEGYLLYPYRPSAVKNRQRWNFGVLYPMSYCETQQSGDASAMQTEVLVEGESAVQLHVKVRCLQLLSRSVGELLNPLENVPPSGLCDFRTVESLAVGDQIFKPWQEAEVREVFLPALGLDSLVNGAVRHPFEFPAERACEPIRNKAGQIVGAIVRERLSVSGIVEVSTQPLSDGVVKICVAIQNITPVDGPAQMAREHALMHSMVSTHTVLGLENGRFISLLDPPESMTQFTACCHNNNTWPVLVGDDGGRDMMLSSPIILYDYPQIAPESPGDLFDGTEIDEILALRIMTMTEDEKREVRESDPRGRDLLERTETLPTEHLMKLHGVLRGLHPSSEKAS